jgi:ribosomal protein L4
MFLFKIGVTSLINDFEKEKKNIKQNSNDIEMLKKDIKYLLQQNIKNKLVVKNDTSILPQTNTKDEITILKNKIKKLNQYIKTLKQPQNTNFIKAYIDVSKASLKNSPYQNGKVIKYVYQDDILYLDGCDKYGWCKIKDKKEYIPKFKLYILNK